jgi:hypothetical protein
MVVCLVIKKWRDKKAARAIYDRAFTLAVFFERNYNRKSKALSTLK